MATAATAQWWVRTDGADTDGGGYDSAIGGGSNLCDAATGSAVAWTDLQQAVGGTITDHGATGLFTSSMIGNSINVVGQGFYWITAVPDANTATVTAGTGAAATFTAGKSGKVGGAFRNPYALANGTGSITAPGTASALVAGNTINIRASGSGSVGSPDYTQAGYATYVAGTAAAGYITWAAYNGTPYIKGNGLWWYNSSFHRFKGLYVTASSNTLSTFGIFGSVVACVLDGCTIDANNQTGLGGINGSGGAGASGVVINCDLVGGGTSSGSGATPSLGMQIKDSRIHGWGAWGVTEGTTTGGVQISNCAIYGNVSGGVSVQATSNLASQIDGCTIDANAGDGVKIASTSAAAWCRLFNNNITGNGTTSGYGINVASGTAAVNDVAIAYADYNNVSNNNTGNYHNLSAGAHDLAASPSYTGSPNFTPGNSALQAAVPLGIGAGGTGFGGAANYLYIGAVQPASSGGAAGMLYMPNLDGV